MITEDKDFMFSDIKMIKKYMTVPGTSDRSCLVNYSSVKICYFTGSSRFYNKSIG